MLVKVRPPVIAWASSDYEALTDDGTYTHICTKIDMHTASD